MVARKFQEFCKIPDIPKRSLNVLVDAYLLACELYYEHHISAMPDSTFDELCVHLKVHYPRVVAETVYGYILDLDSIEAGTGYANKPPNVIKVVAKGIADAYSKRPKVKPRPKIGGVHPI